MKILLQSLKHLVIKSSKAIGKRLLRFTRDFMALSFSFLSSLSFVTSNTLNVLKLGIFINFKKQTRPSAKVERWGSYGHCLCFGPENFASGLKFYLKTSNIKSRELLIT